MKTHLIYIIIILLLGITLFITRDSNRDDSLKADPKVSTWIRRATDAEARAARSDTFLTAQREKSTSDSLRHAKTQSKLTSDLNALKRHERKQRPDTIKITATDTVYFTYDALVQDLKDERDSIRINSQVTIDTLQAVKTDLRAKLKVGKDLMDDLDQRLQKEERKRFGIGFSVGYGVQQHNSEVTVGPNVQVSLHYSLWKF